MPRGVPIDLLRSVTSRDIAEWPEFDLGSLTVVPARRAVRGPAGERSLQPQIMLVLACLVRAGDSVVPRRALFEQCWGSAPVGDDSLNRAITAIRRILAEVGADDLTVETIPRTGYRLVIKAPAPPASGPLSEAAQAAYDCWRTGAPRPDEAEIAALARALQGSRDAREWGVLALSLRKAAEYAEADECAAYVQRCEGAARRALRGDPSEPHARVALIGLAPLYGNWTAARAGLLAVLADHPGNPPARHELAVLEMATGRPSAAVPLIEGLLAEDGYAATFHYKRMYHLWTLGELHAAEHAAARALQLWPRHPAIWSARFWMLLHTGRADQALRMVEDTGSRPAMPEPAIVFFAQIARAVAAAQAGTLGEEALSAFTARCVGAAASGAAQAVAALLGLCAVDAIAAAFTVARGYYLGEGAAAAPLRRSAHDASITDQHRRVTQPLFIPASARLREDPRFAALCADIGLARYWAEAGVVPDFRSGAAAHCGA